MLTFLRKEEVTMKKKLLSIALALFMAVAVFPLGLPPASVSAEEADELYLEAENYLTYKVYALGTTEDPTTTTFSPTDSAIKVNEAYHGGKRFEHNFGGVEKVEVEIPFTVSETGFYNVTLDSICTNGYTNNSSKLYLDGEEFIKISPSSNVAAVSEWIKSVRNGVELIKDRNYTFMLSFDKAINQSGYCYAKWDYIHLKKMVEPATVTIAKTGTTRIEAENYYLTKKNTYGTHLSYIDFCCRTTADASEGLVIDSDYETGGNTVATALSFDIYIQKRGTYSIKPKVLAKGTQTYTLYYEDKSSTALTMSDTPAGWVATEVSYYLEPGVHSFFIGSTQTGESSLCGFSADYIDVTLIDAKEYYYEAEDYLTYQVYALGTTENPTTRTFSSTDSVIVANSDYHDGKIFKYNFGGVEKAEVEIPVTVPETGSYRIVLNSAKASIYESAGGTLSVDGTKHLEISSVGSARHINTVGDRVNLNAGQTYSFKLCFNRATGQSGYCVAEWDFFYLERIIDEAVNLSKNSTTRFEAEDYFFANTRNDTISGISAAVVSDNDASGGAYLDSGYRAGGVSHFDIEVNISRQGYYKVKPRILARKHITSEIRLDGSSVATISDYTQDDAWITPEYDLYLTPGIYTISISSISGGNSGLSQIIVDYVDITPDDSKIASVNLAPYGTFDEESDVIKFTGGSGESKWVEDSVGGHYASTAAGYAWYCSYFAYVPVSEGEIYDVFFDAKIDSGTDSYQILSGLKAEANMGTGKYTIEYAGTSSNRKLTSEWSREHIVIKDIGGTDSDGNDVSTDKLGIGIIRGAGVGAWIHLDNLEIYARGHTNYDWTTYINSLNRNMEPFDADDGFAEEQPETGEAYKSFYVDAQNGIDSNDGTSESAPVKTIEKARQLVKPHLASMTGHIYVYIKGEHNLEDTITWTTEDSGQNGYNVIYTSWGDAQPQISMKQEYSGFELHDKDKNIWRTFVGLDNRSRQVYINGIRGIRARTSDPLNPAGLLHNPRRPEGFGEKSDYYLANDLYLADLTNQEDVELLDIAMWTNSRIKVDKIYKIDDETVRIDFNKNSWDLNRDNISAHTGINPPTWIENAYELLDAKGEWYINRKDGYLYYKPRDYETPEKMVATIPVGSQAFIIDGGSTETKVHNIVFDNLSFKYLTWNYPGIDEYGIRETLGFYMRRDGVNPYPGDGRTTGETADAAITVLDAAYVDIRNCTLSKLGGNAINYMEVFQGCEVTGNHIYDVSGTGIMFGHMQRMKRDEIKYFAPTEYKNYIINNKINNNLIHDQGTDYRGAPAIIAPILINSEIMHNEIYNTQYTGLFVGVGLGSFIDKIYSNVGVKVMYNYVHDIMPYLFDGGAIYIMGAAGGKNECAYNYFENIIMGSNLYCDTGTDYWHLYSNVIEQRETGRDWRQGTPIQSHNYGKMYNNYSTTSSPLSSNDQKELIEDAKVYENADWPAEAQEIIDNAGLESQYLAKHPDSAQRLRLTNEKKAEHFLDIGDTLKMNVEKVGRKLNNMGTTDIYYYSTNEEVATVSAKGTITAKANGICAIYAEYLDGDVTRQKNLNLVVGDEVKSLTFDTEHINLAVGGTATVTATSTTQNGNTRQVVPTATFDTEGVVTLSSTGVLTATKEGKTVAHLTFTDGGKTLEKDVAIYVASYNRGDTTAALFDKSTKLTKGNDFFKEANWTGHASATSSLLTAQIQVSGTKHDFMPAYYKTALQDELITFKATINSTMGNPSIVLKAKDISENYEGDGYLITFKDAGIELHRLIDGNRTTIFGDLGYRPIGAATFARGSHYSFGSEFTITIGTQDVDEGVRIILLINKTPVFDYTDTDAEAQQLKGPGHIGFYEWTGNFVLKSYSWF